MDGQDALPQVWPTRPQQGLLHSAQGVLWVLAVSCGPCRVPCDPCVPCAPCVPCDPHDPSDPCVPRDPGHVPCDPCVPCALWVPCDPCGPDPVGPCLLSDPCWNVLCASSPVCLFRPTGIRELSRFRCGLECSTPLPSPGHSCCLLLFLLLPQRTGNVGKWNSLHCPIHCAIAIILVRS